MFIFCGDPGLGYLYEEFQERYPNVLKYWDT